MNKHVELTKIAQYLASLENLKDAELILEIAGLLQDSYIVVQEASKQTPAKPIGTHNNVGNLRAQLAGYRNDCQHEWNTDHGQSENCKLCGRWRMGYQV